MNTKKATKQMVLILDNIRSSENVGSLFRTADAFGISEILLVGITPTPIDRFGRPNPKVAKTALGAEKTITWQHVATAEEAISYIQKQKLPLYVLEQDTKAIPLAKQKERDFALVLGNEVQGVSDYFLKHADIIFEIPMQGEKESLNVSVAGGIALYALTA